MALQQRIKFTVDEFESGKVVISHQLATDRFPSSPNFVKELVELIERHGGVVEGSVWTKEMMGFVKFK